MHSESAEESAEVTAFRRWLQVNGAYLHHDAHFVKGPNGMSVHSDKKTLPNIKVASCPFSLAVTPAIARRALMTISKCTDDVLDAFSESELICTYLAIHWILDELKVDTNITDFTHLPYLRTLPAAESMRTALHFNETERFLLKGTNLFGAIVDRLSEREAEWRRCKAFVGAAMSAWEIHFTWSRYLTASAYLSSRSFPSTLLSSAPSLITSPSSYPVLLPGIDAFNHSRTQQVSWLIEDVTPGMPSSVTTKPEALQVSLIILTSTEEGCEIFNNYGPKPNSELILGYGFSIPQNPDDNILLKVGGQRGSTGKLWEVGRNARGAEGLWDEIRTIISDDVDGEAAEWELDLETAQTLMEMTETKLGHLPDNPTVPPVGVRGDVFEMIQTYVLGQKEILQSLMEFASRKRQCAVQHATDSAEFTFGEDMDGDFTHS